MDKQGLLGIHPGEVLEEDFLKPLEMTRYRLAKEIGISPTAAGEIVEGTRSITPETALRLSRFFGTSAKFWLNLQASYDLEIAEERIGEKLNEIRPIRAAA